jgi:hypothetical protein
MQQTMTSVPARQAPWRARRAPKGQPVLTVHGQLMRDLATRAMAAGGGGLTKVGVASVQHGEGATTISRSLAVCLAEDFGQRVVLIEANHRSPCLREMCGLPPGAGLSDVLSGAASLEATLRMSRAAGKMLVLPASETPGTHVATLSGRERAGPCAGWCGGGDARRQIDACGVHAGGGRIAGGRRAGARRGVEPGAVHGARTLRKQFFSEENNQKTWVIYIAAARWNRDSDIKVFCFFSSESVWKVF